MSDNCTFHDLDLRHLLTLRPLNLSLSVALRDLILQSIVDCSDERIHNPKSSQFSTRLARTMSPMRPDDIKSPSSSSVENRDKSYTSFQEFDVIKHNQGVHVTLNPALSVIAVMRLFHTP